MSGKLRLNGATSGYIELQAEGAANNATLTIPNDGFGGGKLLQVVYGQIDAYKTNGGTSWSEIMSVSITPSSSSSKILIRTHGMVSASGSNTYAAHRLLRGSTDLTSSYQGYGYESQESSWGAWVGHGSARATQSYMEYLDSPSTTSSTTYYWQHQQTPGGSSNGTLGLGGTYRATLDDYEGDRASAAGMCLMEIST